MKKLTTEEMVRNCFCKDCSCEGHNFFHCPKDCIAQRAGFMVDAIRRFVRMEQLQKFEVDRKRIHREFEKNKQKGKGK